MSSLALSRLPLAIARLGRQPYQQVWSLQKRLQADLISGCGQDTLIVCEHPPAITLGRSSKIENILLPKAKLDQIGVSVFQTERGGDVTFHGPGQLVAYPIIDLRKKRQDVSWYIRELEQTVIETLHHFGINGGRIKGRAGVWITDTEENDSQNKKISCVGVRLSRWCTMHGIALNVHDCSRGFALINPCGYRDIEITSIEQLSKVRPNLLEVQEQLISCFINRFYGYN